MSDYSDEGSYNYDDGEDSDGSYDYAGSAASSGDEAAPAVDVAAASKRLLRFCGGTPSDFETPEPERLKATLDTDVDVNVRSPVDGSTPLACAAFWGSTRCVELLLLSETPAGAALDVNLSDKQGTTALMAAATMGHAEVVGLLLGRADIQASKQDNKGETALRMAIGKAQDPSQPIEDIARHELVVAALASHAGCALEGFDLNAVSKGVQSILLRQMIARARAARRQAAAGAEAAEAAAVAEATEAINANTGNAADLRNTAVIMSAESGMEETRGSGHAIIDGAAAKALSDPPDSFLEPGLISGALDVLEACPRWPLLQQAGCRLVHNLASYETEPAASLLRRQLREDGAVIVMQNAWRNHADLRDRAHGALTWLKTETAACPEGEPPSLALWRACGGDKHDWYVPNAEHAEAILRLEDEMLLIDAGLGELGWPAVRCAAYWGSERIVAALCAAGCQLVHLFGAGGARPVDLYPGIQDVIEDELLLRCDGRGGKQRKPGKRQDEDKWTAPDRCDRNGCRKPVAAVCAYCARAWYCSLKCQQTEWARHKQLCVAARPRRAAAAAARAAAERVVEAAAQVSASIEQID